MLTPSPTEVTTRDLESRTDPVIEALARLEAKVDAMRADVQSMLAESRQADELGRLRFATTTQQLADIYGQLADINDAVGTGRGNK